MRHPPTRVHLAVDIGGAPVPVGWADVTFRSEAVSGCVFQYDPGYVARRGAWAISPELPLGTRPFPLSQLPGALLDAAPDAWGRNLIRRDRRRRGLSSTSDIDALLGVSDRLRQGALRVRLEPGGEFLAGGGAPPCIELPELLAAAHAALADVDDEASVRQLLAAGSQTMGGARPKAVVLDGERLMLAKFPASPDQHDVIAWEAATLTLAARAGIEVPPHRLVHVGHHAVLLLDRFDRGAGGERVPYWSARTLTGDGTDYLDVVEAIQGGEFEHPRRDGAELWRRVAFSVAVHNTDDHLGNLGFLRGRHGWALAPLFDVNPDPVAGRARATAIAGETHPAHEDRGLVEFAGELGLATEQWHTDLAGVLAALGSWRQAASASSVPAAQIERFAPVIEGAAQRLARLLR